MMMIKYRLELMAITFNPKDEDDNSEAKAEAEMMRVNKVITLLFEQVKVLNMEFFFIHFNCFHLGFRIN